MKMRIREVDKLDEGDAIIGSITMIQVRDEHTREWKDRWGFSNMEEAVAFLNARGFEK